MSLENDFLIFAGASGANVLTQSAYAAASTTATGYVSGTASSAAVNKTLRQTSIMSAMIAQFIVDKAAETVIDDGTIATIEANFEAAILAIADTVNIPISQVTGLAAALAGYLPLTGNAVSSSKLATARQIALTGAVTGDVNFDGSGNVSITTTFGNIAASTLLGNPTGSSASPTTITLANGLQFASGALGLGAITPASVNTGVITGSTASLTGALNCAGITSTGANIAVSATQPAINIVNTSSGGTTWTLQSSATGQIGGAGALLFYNQTSGGELMTLSTGGVLTIFGNNSNGNTLIVEDTATGGAAFGGITLKSTNGSTNPNKTWRANGSSGNMEMVNSNYSSVPFTISDGGLVTAVTFNATSDGRVKPNPKRIEGALETVERWLVGQTYMRSDTGKFEAGFIAQSVEEGLPHLVSTRAHEGYDNFRFLDYDHVTPYLANAIAELAASVRAINARAVA